jgi:hypothetical protein
MKNITHEECVLDHLHSHAQTHKVCMWKTAHMDCCFGHSKNQPSQLQEGIAELPTK